MRRQVLVILLSLILLPLQAQSLRTVKGLVADESGFAVAGAVLKVNGYDGTFTSDRMGRFEFKAPFSSTTITAYKDGYPATKVEINGTYVLVRLLKSLPVEHPVTEKVAPEPVETKPAETRPEPSQPDKSKPEKTKQEKAPATGRFSDKPGFSFAIDLSYAYNFRYSTVTCTNIGEQLYGTFHPLELTAGFGYRFNSNFTLLAGGGFMYNLVTPDMMDPVDEATYPDVKVRKWDIPAYLALKVSFCKGAVRPLILAQGGIYAMSLAPYAELGAGMAVRTGGTTAVNIIVSAKNNPWQYFTPTSYEGYPFSISPSVKVGFSF